MIAGSWENRKLNILKKGAASQHLFMEEMKVKDSERHKQCEKGNQNKFNVRIVRLVRSHTHYATKDSGEFQSLGVGEELR